MVDKNEFKWTPELIAEFFNDFVPEVSLNGELIGLMENFKSQKQPPSVQRDWVVTSIGDSRAPYRHWDIDENGKLNGQSYDYVLNCRIGNGYYIRSVKRFSDREVFFVDNLCEQGNIKSFQISGNEIYATFESGDTGCQVDIRQLKKAKPILFTTLDGKPIYEGEKYFIVDNLFTRLPFIARESWDEIDGVLGRFSTKEAAQTYIDDNKPSYSFKQIMEALHKAEASFNSIMLKYNLSKEQP